MKRCSVITTGRIETDHIAALEGLQGPVTIDRRCADLAELVAAAGSVRMDAALIIGGTTSLTGTLLDDLRHSGLRVVVISDLPEERRRLASLGVTALRDDVEVERLAELLRGASTGTPPPPPSWQEDSSGESALKGASREEMPQEETGYGETGDAEAGGPEDGFENILAVSGLTDEHRTSSVSGRAPGGSAGKIVFAPSEEKRAAADEGDADAARAAPAEGMTVIWGAHGSPGRTTVAVNMAAELAGAGHRVLLIDADTTAAGVVTHLGLLEESAGLAQACRQADLGRLDAARLRRASITAEVNGHRLHLLTGIPRSSRWPELRSRALRQVFQLARNEYTCVIVDVSASAEQDEELTYDTAAPQRHAATVSALQEADRILAVGSCDPLGFPRLVKAFEDIRHEVPDAPGAEPVITKVRRSVIGRSPEEQLRSTWERFGPESEPLTFLPWDAEACDAALLQGQALAEAAPDSGLRRSIAALAGVDLRTRRKRRLGLSRREFALG